MGSERYKNQPLRSEYIDISATGLYQNKGLWPLFFFKWPLFFFDKGLWPKYQYIHFVKVDFYTFRNLSRYVLIRPLTILSTILEAQLVREIGR